MANNQPRVRILDRPAEWLEDLWKSDPGLAQEVLSWILGPFVDEDDLDSTEIEEEGAPAYVTRIPGTDIEVFWRAPANGIPQVYWIESLPPPK